MRRYRIALLLAGMTSAGCRDSTVIDPVASAPAAPADPTTFTMRGSITVEGGQIKLRAYGSTVRLLGSEARRLRDADGADVLVQAIDGSVGGLFVRSFTVLAMNGLPAIDGVLEAAGGGYALRPANGSPRQLTDPPSALIQHVGARMWVTGDVSKEIIAFGLLE